MEWAQAQHVPPNAKIQVCGDMEQLTFQKNSAFITAHSESSSLSWRTAIILDTLHDRSVHLVPGH